MVDRPELSRRVKAFTWTLVWMDFDEHDLTDIDFHTWDVFGRMQNVTLASLHSINNPQYIRQNPTQLFPAVTDLRLVGWMNRGLVRAIVTSIDATKLCSLNLDHLQDEGALPNGQPMPRALARRYYHQSEDPYGDEGIVDDELWARQERGDAGIFPGSMWSPLRSLRQNSLASVAHIQIRVGYSTEYVDARNDITMFLEIAEFIRSAKDTLKTISIGLGEDPVLHCDGKHLTRMCGTNQGRIRSIHRPFCFDRTSAFLHRLLPALTGERFANLTRVDLEGFRIIRNGTSRLLPAPDPDLTWRYIRDCPFVDDEFTKTPNDDYRQPFNGYKISLADMDPDQLDKLCDSLQRS